MPERMAAALEHIHAEDPLSASAVTKSEKIDWKHIALAIILTLLIMALTATIIWLVTNEKEVRSTEGKANRNSNGTPSVPPLATLKQEQIDGSGEGGIGSSTSDSVNEGSGEQILSPVAARKKEVPRFISLLFVNPGTWTQVPQMEEVEGSIETSGIHKPSRDDNN